MSNSTKFIAEAGQSILLHDGEFILSLKTVSSRTILITRLKCFVGTAAEVDGKVLELKLKSKSQN